MIAEFVPFGVKHLDIGSRNNPGSPRDSGLKDILEKTTWALFRDLRSLLLNIRGPTFDAQINAFGNTLREKIDWSGSEINFNIDSFFHGPPLHLESTTIALWGGVRRFGVDRIIDDQEPRHLLPSFTEVAKALVAFGGPLCKYTFRLGGKHTWSVSAEVLGGHFQQRKRWRQRGQPRREDGLGFGGGTRKVVISERDYPRFIISLLRRLCFGWSDVSIWKGSLHASISIIAELSGR